MLAAAMRGRISILAVTLLVAGCQSQTPSGSASPSSTASETQSAAPSVAASATDPGPAAWSETGSFNDTGGFSLVIDIAQNGTVVVAVGTQYVAPIPNFGFPPDHDGRLWISEDGYTWSDAAPAGVFDGVSLNQVLATPAGGFVAFGFGPAQRAWGSADGETWTEIPSPFPANSTVTSLASGAQGYLTLVDGPARQLWFSGDGAAWAATYALADQAVSIGAGDEGFAVAGTANPGTAQAAPFGIASSDGSGWVPAATPPSVASGAVHVAPHAGDWYAMANGDLTATTPVSFSANGLDWAQSGSMPLAEVQADATTTCREFVTALHGSTPWLVATSRLSFPCSEGGFVVHGTQRASTDGTTWTDLPFAAGTPGQTGSGSAVFATVMVNGRLVLAGQSNSAATFWIGE
jgi:hypothetical protein